MLKSFQTIIISSILLISFSLFAQEKVDTFIIRMFSNRVVILSPENVGKEVTVIIENNTISKLIGKIVNQKNEIILSISVLGNNSSNYVLRAVENDKYFFIPLSPSFQEVPLIIGARPYEIPPKS